MRHRAGLASMAVVGAVAALIVAWSGTDTPDRVAGPTCSTASKTANLNFTLPDLGGADVPLASFRGKVVYLNFWATWCGPCRLETPVLVDLHRQYQPRGFEVVGIVVDDDFPRAKPFADEFRMPYTILDGTSDRQLEREYSPVPLPKSFLLARDGSICSEHIGVPRPRGNESVVDSIRRVLEAEIKALL